MSWDLAVAQAVRTDSSSVVCDGGTRPARRPVEPLLGGVSGKRPADCVARRSQTALSLLPYRTLPSGHFPENRTSPSSHAGVVGLNWLR